MKQAEYKLCTYTMADTIKSEAFIGTRQEARAKARKIDEDTFGQVTKARFVKYI